MGSNVTVVAAKLIDETEQWKGDTPHANEHAVTLLSSDVISPAMKQVLDRANHDFRPSFLGTYRHQCH